MALKQLLLQIIDRLLVAVGVNEGHKDVENCRVHEQRPCWNPMLFGFPLFIRLVCRGDF